MARERRWMAEGVDMALFYDLGDVAPRFEELLETSEFVMAEIHGKHRDILAGRR